MLTSRLRVRMVKRIVIGKKDCLTESCKKSLFVFRGKNGNQRKFCDACIVERRRARQRRRWAIDKEKIVKGWRKAQAAYMKEYRAKNKERLAAYSKSWLANHPGKKTAYMNKWRAENRDRHLVKALKDATRRRARKVNVFVEDVDRDIVFARDKGKCGICNKKIDPAAPFDIDHVIPLSLGGKHSYANVQISHPVCNRRKGNRVGKKANNQEVLQVQRTAELSKGGNATVARPRLSSRT